MHKLVTFHFSKNIAVRPRLQVIQNEYRDWKAIFKHFYVLLFCSLIYQRTELFSLMCTINVQILPFLTSPIAPHTSNKKTSGKAKSPRTESSASAKSSGFFLSLPASTMVVAAEKMGHKNVHIKFTHSYLQLFWCNLVIFKPWDTK